MANPTYLADYVTVAERLAAFVEKYPEGRIETTLDRAFFDPASGNGLVVVAAKVWKTTQDPMTGFVPPDGTGLSSMPIPGPTNFTKGSEVENAETSAIGRALAAIGFLAKNTDGSPRISSQDEIDSKNPDHAPLATEDQFDPPITQKQRGMLMSLAKKAGMDPNTPEGKKELQAVTLAATGKFNSKQLTNADVDLLVAALETADGE